MGNRFQEMARQFLQPEPDEIRRSGPREAGTDLAGRGIQYQGTNNLLPTMVREFAEVTVSGNRRVGRVRRRRTGAGSRDIRAQHQVDAPELNRQPLFVRMISRLGEHLPAPHADGMVRFVDVFDAYVKMRLDQAGARVRDSVDAARAAALPRREDPCTNRALEALPT